jgi:probable addiction module antidote protein
MATSSSRLVRKSPAKRGAKTKTVPYDVAEQLRTPAEMAAYLDAWLTEAPDDAAGIARALGDIARAKGMTSVAREAGLSRESLYKALSEDGNPSFATVLKVARALGLRLHAEALDRESGVLAAAEPSGAYTVGKRRLTRAKRAAGRT